MSITPSRIDIHHHVIPRPVVELYHKLGMNDIAGIPIPEFEEERTLKFMDSLAIRTAVVSLADVGPAFAKENHATEIARTANDYYAQLRAAHPGRFGAFAVLPLPHIEAAQKELTRALEELKLDGVMLMSNHEGVYLGDFRLEPLMQELNRRRAVVFVHPTAPPAGSASASTLAFRTFMLDFVFETTRAITNLLLTDTLRKYPDIRFIFAHLGGTVPFLTERLALSYLNHRFVKPDAAPSKSEKGTKIISAITKVVPSDVLIEKLSHSHKLLSQLYYDTAFASSPASLAAVQKVAAPGHILFGTDFPAAPEPIAAHNTHMLVDRCGLLPEEVEAITRSNPQALFPQFG